MEKAMEHKTGKSTRSVVVLILCTVIMMAAGFANFKFPPILTDYLAYYGIEMVVLS